MERIDLSSYASEIKKAYNDVVSGDKAYAIFTTQKDSALKPTSVSDGDIKDFVSEFEEGSVQFGILKVSPYGSDVNKIVLLGWCPDSAPLKSRISYATNFADVGKVLSYHVDITARDFDDLDVDDIIQTVSKASGARYSIQSLPKPKVTKFRPSPKASSTPSASSTRPATFKAPSLSQKPAKPAVKEADADEWGGEAEVEVRDLQKEPLTELPSAYKRTEVDIDALRGKKAAPKPTPKAAPSPIQPPLKPTQPSLKPTQAPLKPTQAPFKPVSKAKPSLPKKSIPAHDVTPSDPVKESKKPAAAPVGSLTINLEGGLSSLPKPKTSKSVLSRFQQKVVTPAFGARPQSFDPDLPSGDDDHKISGLKDYGSESGLTPAQLWAKKKGKFREVPKAEKPVNAAEEEPAPAPVSDVKSKFEKMSISEKTPEEKPAPTQSLFDKFKSTAPAQPILPLKHEPIKEELPKDEPEEIEEPEEPEEPEIPQRSEPEIPQRSEPEIPQEPETPQRSEPEIPEEPPKQNEPTEPAPQPAVETHKAAHTAIAEYDYEKDEDNEISFKEGEKIVGIEMVDKDWWLGSNAKGESGLFPATYVRLDESNESAQPEPEENSTAEAEAPVETPEETASGPSAVAEYDYDAAESNELTFREGDVIENIDKVDSDWWLGTFKGERKLFPANYVSLRE